MTPARESAEAFHSPVLIACPALGYPDHTDFMVGNIGREQTEEYAKRKDMGLREVERWLAPYLGYDPD